MDKKLLLISNSTNAGEAYLGWCGTMIKEFTAGHRITDVLFVPYAGVSMGYDAYEERVAAVFDTLGLTLHSLHRAKDPVESVQTAQCIAVGGGNTFHLVYELWRLGVMEVISRRAEEGMPYMGWSAGSNVACPSLKTTNDMPIIEPKSFDCMNLVKFQINPHYTDFFDPKHGGETRQDRINEFLKVNPDINVVGLREATALSLEDGKLRLIGRNNPLVLFRYNKEPEHYGLDSDLNFLL